MDFNWRPLGELPLTILVVTDDEDIQRGGGQAFIKLELSYGPGEAELSDGSDPEPPIDAHRDAIVVSSELAEHEKVPPSLGLDPMVVVTILFAGSLLKDVVVEVSKELLANKVTAFLHRSDENESSAPALTRDTALKAAEWRIALSYKVDRSSLALVGERYRLRENTWTFGFVDNGHNQYEVEIGLSAGQPSAQIISKRVSSPRPTEAYSELINYRVEDYPLLRAVEEAFAIHSNVAESIRTGDLVAENLIVDLVQRSTNTRIDVDELRALVRRCAAEDR